MSTNGITVTIDGNTMTIKVTLQAPTPSATGKTMVVASTRGNITTGAKVDGQEVILGLNAYIKR